MTTKELTFALCSLDGTSGDEAAISDYISSIMPGAYKDKLGNVIAQYNSDGKVKILIEAHMDRIGYVVTGIDDGGFLKLAKVGGPDFRTTVGSAVTVFCEDGPVFGVICSKPPHLKSADDSKKITLKDLAVDIGMSKEKAESKVAIGDRVILNDVPSSLCGDNFACSSLDNRAGVASIILAAQALKDKLKNVCLQVVFNSREEVGGQGAATTTYSLAPDYAICVDAGFGRDFYTIGEESIALAGGPSIGIAPVLDFVMMKELKKLAKENDIPFQHDVMNGRTGTDADEVCNTKGGLKTALLSIPVCNMHTQVEIANSVDIENTAKLIECFVFAKEAENA